MPVSLIPLPILKFWEVAKEMFSMDKDFPAPPPLDQQESIEDKKKQDKEKLVRMRQNYRHW